MIVPMKKVSVIVMDYDREKTLNTMREAGVLHVKDKKQGGQDWSALDKDRQRYSEALDFLVAHGDSEEPKEKVKDGLQRETLLEEVERIKAELSEVAEEKKANQKEQERLEPWGDFNPGDIATLKAEGIQWALYEMPQAALEETFTPETLVFELARDKKTVRCAAIHYNRSVDSAEKSEALPDRYQVEMPVKSLTTLHGDFTLLEAREEALKKEIQDLQGSRILLSRGLKDIEQKIEYTEVRDGMDEAEGLVVVSGFLPAAQVDSFKETAAQERWAVMVDDPSPEEHVPTKLKNNRVVRMIDPVMKVLGITPGYREYDISSYFLFFFAIFVAMIIGDGGYGLILLGGAVGLHLSGLSQGKKPTIVHGLLYTLSLTTVFWGAITGNWFGSYTLAQWAPLKALIIPQIATFPELFQDKTIDAEQTIMYICFILGAVQISIAHIKGFLAKLPRLEALADLGWLSMVISLYFLVLNLVMGRTLPGFVVPVIGIGFLTVMVFANQKPGQSFLKGLLSGLGGLFTQFLDSIGAFADIMSYIRLFAVGMASFSIASSFNAMASPLMGDWKIVIAILILFLGHTLNIAMAILSVFVHGIRLNVLEFSGHLGMEWSGIPYKPFKK